MQSSCAIQQFLWFSVSNVQMTKSDQFSPWPALKGGDDKEREHRLHDVVVMEGTSNPLASFHDRLVDVTVRVGDELPLARAVVVHGQVGAHEELPLEKLNPDNSKHEDQEHCHSHDISDGLH